jgi:hypothetical protein
MRKFLVHNSLAREDDIVCDNAARAAVIFMGLHPDQKGNAIIVKDLGPVDEDSSN